MLIHLIDTELTKYDVFYQRLIPSMQTDALFIEESEKIEKTLTKIDSLKRKMLHIKNTTFYKEISKVNLNLRKIQPTNILLKNKLYNLCYKFYRKFVIYEDNKNLQIDFKKYYYYQILRVFKLNEFKLDDKNQSLVFNYQDKKIKLVDNEENSKISLEIKYHNNVYKHLLILSTDRELIDEYAEDKDYITTEVISLWNLYNVDTNEFVFNNQASEIEIARKWVMSKLQEVVAKKMIYSKYCPICKDKNLTIENDIYHLEPQTAAVPDVKHSRRRCSAAAFSMSWMVNTLSLTLNSFHLRVSWRIDLRVMPGRISPFRGHVISSFSPCSLIQKKKMFIAPPSMMMPSGPTPNSWL